MSLLAELNSLFAAYGFRAERRLAQFFLVEEETIAKIVKEAGLKNDDVVLEIGAGTGFLTREIAKKCRVLAVEVDEKLCRLLSERMDKNRVGVFCLDFLEINFSDFPKFNKIVSAPPYTASSHIMFKVLPTNFERAVLVFQREFADKLVAEPGFKEYGALSVLTQYYSAPRVLRNLSPNDFFPKPPCFSAPVVLDGCKRFGVVKNEAAFSGFVQNVFRFKNKNFSNALQNSSQFIEGLFKCSEAELLMAAASLGIAAEKVNLLFCRDFVEFFNKAFKG